MATKKKAQEVVEVKETANALTTEQAPAWLTKGSKGKENIGQGDVELPQIKILQGTTPGLNENGWQTGNFLHSISEQTIPGVKDENGEGGFLFTPIIAMKARYRLFNPMDQGGGILARADDGVHWNPPNHEFKVKINNGSKEVTYKTAKTVAASGLDQWGSMDPGDPNSPPAADQQFRYLCSSPSHPHFGPFIVLLQRSGIAAAMRLNAFLTASEYDSYGLVFRANSLWDDKGPSNKKFIWKFTPAGYENDPDRGKKNLDLYEQFKDLDIDVHDEQATVVDDDAMRVVGSQTAGADDDY